MKTAWLKAAIEWGGFFVALVVAMQVISWWQTRDLLDTGGQVQIPTLVLPSLASTIDVTNTPPSTTTNSSTTTPTLRTLAPDPTRNTLIYFFAPWCSICRMSIGNLDSVNTTHTNVVVVALDYESVADVQNFVDEVGVEQPVLLGDSRISQMFQIKGFPTYYILDQEFRVISRDMGYSSGAGLTFRAWQATPNR